MTASRYRLSWRTNARFMVGLGLTLGSLTVASPATAQPACTIDAGLTANLETVQVDATARLHVVFWGWDYYDGTQYSDIYSPWDSEGGNDGIGGTRWVNTIQQYPGYQYDTGAWIPSPTSQSPLVLDYWHFDTIDIPWDAGSGHNCSPTYECQLPTSAMGPIAYQAYEDIKAVESVGTSDVIAIIMPPYMDLPSPDVGLNGSTDGVLWEVIAYSSQTNMERMATHEYAEVITDSSEGTSGWIDPFNANCQIADPCQGAGNAFQVQVQPKYNADEYDDTPSWTQQLLSMESGSTCVYGRTQTVYEWGIGGSGDLYFQRVNANNLASGGVTLGGTWYEFGSGSPYGFAGKPTATSNGPDRIDTFVVDTHNNFWHGYSDNGGSSVGWEWSGESGDSNFSNPYLYYQWVASNPICWPDAASVGAGNEQVYAFMVAPGYGQPILVKDYDDNDGWSGWAEINSGANQPISKISAAAFGASNGGSGFPSSNRSVMLAYIDNANALELGMITDGEPTWVSWPLSDWSFTGVDCDIALWSPGRFDVFIRDNSGGSTGNMWDCIPNVDGVWSDKPRCTQWTTSSHFNQPPGAIGLGDNRLYVVGTSVGSGGYSEPNGLLFDYNGSTGFVNNGGGFIGGVDLSSW